MNVNGRKYGGKRKILQTAVAALRAGTGADLRPAGDEVLATFFIVPEHSENALGATHGEI